MVNKVILIGNLGQDPDVKSTQGGQSVANLSIATSERRKDRDGNWTDHTEWHKVTAWGNTAENVGKFCKKGKQVYIEGRLQTRKWQDKEGKDRYTTEIVADVVRFLGGKEGGGERETQHTRSQYDGDSRRPDNTDRRPNPSHGPDDEIPF